MISIRHTTACNCIPANTKRWHSAGLMLAHRLRRWSNIKPALCQHLVFAGISISILYSGETGLPMRHSKIKRWYPIMEAILNFVGQICCHFGLSCIKYHYDLGGRVLLFLASDAQFSRYRPFWILAGISYFDKLFIVIFDEGIYVMYFYEPLGRKFGPF